ncbi:MAG: helix-turn-helix domain-containing protein [Spirochaetales bacterium]|nr:helix-turn-helix domain-containing protein [Spirochaetales bacterium]
MTRKDVRRKLFYNWGLSYLLIMIIPLVLFIVFAITSIASVRDSVERANRTALTSIGNELDSAILQVNALCEELLLSDSFRSLGSIGTLSDLDPYTLYLKTQELRHMTSSRSYIIDCLLFSTDLDCYISTQYYGKLSSIHRNDVLDVRLSEDLADKLFWTFRNYTFIQDVSMYDTGEAAKPRFLAIRPFSYVRSQNIGDFCVAVLVDVSSIMSNSELESYNVLVYDDDSEQVLFSYGDVSGSESIETKLDEMDSGEDRSIDGTMVISTDSAVSGIRYFLLVKESVYFKDLNNVTRIMAVLIAAAIVLSGFTIYRLLNRNWNRFSDAVSASGTDISSIESSGNPYQPFVSSVSKLKAENRSYAFTSLVMSENTPSVRSLSELGIVMTGDWLCIALASGREGDSAGFDDKNIMDALSRHGISAFRFDSGYHLSLILNSSEAALQGAQQLFDEAEGILYCAVSNPVMEISELHKAYLQASNMMEYRRTLALAQNAGEGYAIYHAALSEIQANYSDTQLNVSQIAYNLGVSIAYLSRCFKKHEETNISEYLTAYRISRAKQLLSDPEETDLSVNDVADRCGFGSTRTFMRVFKASEGVTPGQYKSAAGK